MSAESDAQERLRSLLVSASDGDATSFELGQLNELLRENEELRQSAARFLCDGSYLADATKSIDETAAVMEELRSDALESGAETGAFVDVVVHAPETTLAGAPSQWSLRGFRASSLLRSAIRVVNRNGLAVGAVAAILMLAFAWHHVTILSKLERLHSIAARPTPVDQEELRNRAQDTGVGTGASSVARVTGLVNCQWRDGVTPLKFGDQLSSGQQLQLERGLMQLTFGSGAKIVVEGPTNFVVASPSEATLELGTIAAAVPRSGRGYTILTPTAEIVDLGTEFGVSVDDDGMSEVHVFEGDVVARPRGGAETDGPLIHARQDEAIQFPATTKQGMRIAADRNKFVRRLTPDRSADELPPLPVTDDLVLWLTADTIAESNEGTLVSTWNDILIGDNRFPDDAWQFDQRLCPKLVRDARGQPAVRFDGWSTFLATSPMETGDRVTAFVVFTPSPVSFAGDFHGGMLLKFGLETPSIEFSLMPDRKPRARVWSSGPDGSNSYVGEVLGKALESQATAAAAYCYNAESNLAELFVNGASCGIASAPRPLKQHARKYIGAHPEPWWPAYFLGNMYEIIVYDAAPGKSDRDLVFQYLSSRYGFTLDE